MSEGVGDAAHSPAIGLVGDGPDYGGSRGYGLVEDGVGVVDGEDDAQGASVERFGAEILVLKGFSASQNSAPSMASCATTDPLSAGVLNISVAPKADL